MNEGTQESEPWTKTSELLPPVGVNVECCFTIPGLSCIAQIISIEWLCDRSVARFLVDDPDKIIFIYPMYWRFIK